jgi:hypothetical protein
MIVFVELFNKKSKTSYRNEKGLTKQIDESCQNITPKFEHFIEYLMADSLQADVHWQSYSKLCHVCLFKYNFIGKYETIEYIGLKSETWIHKNYFKSGKTQENYKLMHSNLTDDLIYNLKDFCKDYLNNRTSIQCPSRRTKYFRKRFREK